MNGYRDSQSTPALTKQVDERDSSFNACCFRQQCAADREEIEQLRGNLSLAEEGLANATQELQQYRAEIERLTQLAEARLCVMELNKTEMAAAIAMVERLRARNAELEGALEQKVNDRAELSQREAEIKRLMANACATGNEVERLQAAISEALRAFNSVDTISAVTILHRALAGSPDEPTESHRER